jgi:hypothetical protein
MAEKKRKASADLDLGEPVKKAKLTSKDLNDSDDSDDSDGRLFEGQFNHLCYPQAGFLAAVQKPVSKATDKPRGFTNSKNDCYRNSVIVALFNSNYFLSYLEWHKENEKPTASHNKYHLVMDLKTGADIYWSNSDHDELDEWMADFWQKCHRDTDGYPERRPALRWQSWPSTITEGSAEEEDTLKTQQDACEFLTWILNRINEQLATLPDYAFHGNALDPKIDNNISLRRTAPQENYNFLCRLTSTRREHGCCHNKARRRMPGLKTSEYITSLPAVRKAKGARSVGLETILAASMEEQQQNPDIKCDRCDQDGEQADMQDRNLVRTKKFQNAPPLLFIQLDRVYMKGALTMRNPAVNVLPVELDLSEHMEPHHFGESCSVKYKLTATIAHKGANPQAGHYITYVRDAVDSQDAWCRVNDKEVDVGKGGKVGKGRSKVEVAHVTDECRHQSFAPVLALYERIYDEDAEKQNQARKPRNPPDADLEYWNKDAKWWNDRAQREDPVDESEHGGNTEDSEQEDGDTDESGPAGGDTDTDGSDAGKDTDDEDDDAHGGRNTRLDKTSGRRKSDEQPSGGNTKVKMRIAIDDCFVFTSAAILQGDFDMNAEHSAEVNLMLEQPGKKPKENPMRLDIAKEVKSGRWTTKKLTLTPMTPQSI